MSYFTVKHDGHVINHFLNSIENKIQCWLENSSAPRHFKAIFNGDLVYKFKLLESLFLISLKRSSDNIIGESSKFPKS